MHTRKFSRNATNEDLLNRLRLSSDPVISSLRKLPKRKVSRLPSDALHLLADQDILPKAIASTSTAVTSDSDDDFLPSSDTESANTDSE